MNEAKLKSLKSTRGSIKGQMTKLYNYVLAPGDKEDIDGFQSKLSRAKVLLKQFEDIENSIFDVDPEHDSGIIDFSEQFYVVESKLNRYIREYNADNPDESQNASHNTINASMSQPAAVRLPKINIEPFCGQYTEWQAFYDLYVKTIHENSNLSPAQKFQYLKGFLKGDAYNLLKHVSITETNYFEAFRKLCARYDRKKHTIKAFLRSFMDQSIIHQASSSSIRKLLDTSDQVIRGLKALGKDAESRDVWLLYILEEKLDAESRALWAQASCEEDLPTLESFFKFLLNRSDALESLKPVASKRSGNQRTAKVYMSTDTNNCSLCNVEHALLECEKFKQLSVTERRQIIKADNRCFNCLRTNHPVFRCLSKLRCADCGKKHHTLLHMNEVKANLSAQITEAPQTTIAHIGLATNSILPTALVRVVDHTGFEHDCRILLDSGSMSTLISEKLCKVLRLPRQKNHTVVSGISGSGNQVTKGSIILTLNSRIGKGQLQVEALVLAKLCSKLPTQSFNSSSYNLNVPLADPNFNISQDIDLILGVQHVFNIILNGRIKHENNVIAVETIFGWVLGGELHSETIAKTSIHLSQIDTEQLRVDDQLKRFWEIEDIPNIEKLTNEEEHCERIFAETTYRNSEGRFVVQLPLKQCNEKLGSSLNLAVSRQRAMERKFQKNPKFKEFYSHFMEEYHQLGHMVEVKGDEAAKLNYLPHHGIIKADNPSKFRVVFDASAKTSTGVSLNDILMVGPTVQPTLYSIILRFRLHKVAISGDVEKMYRQILVKENHQSYQAIVWRSNECQPMKYFKLKTLTYGTAAAPYLATRTLNEIADIHRNEFPAASLALTKNTYVDDLMTGANSVEEAMKLRNNLIMILAEAGMKLRKWISNSNEFLSATPISDRAEAIKDFSQEGITIKVLGLQWDPKLDVFSYHVRISNSACSKRKLLSEFSQIFDPLGWLSPVIIKIKILFQSLWLIALDWDDELPPSIKQKYMAIREQLPHLEKIRIPRWLKIENQDVELHGFCDASERA